MHPLLSPKELATALGIAEQTIYNRHSSGGDLPPCIKLGRLLRFRREDVEAWLQRKLPSAQFSQEIRLPASSGQAARRRGRPTIAEQLSARRAG
ncbi:helix-turn-helix transcriptional regulator [Burkholderia gladioli]|uniref:helix-turn-helix transcriptional regulator n=1 Tax=Burkholderia gladioli TaxID=28095 RepID=UPI003F7903FE